jgi:hypothetical protein
MRLAVRARGCDRTDCTRVLRLHPAARTGLRGVDLNSGTLGTSIVDANGKPVRRLADLSYQLESVGVDFTPSRQAWANTVGRSSAICSLYRMPALLPRVRPVRGVSMICR